jgi:hypothetical protein
MWHGSFDCHVASAFCVSIGTFVQLKQADCSFLSICVDVCEAAALAAFPSIYLYLYTFVLVKQVGLCTCLVVCEAEALAACKSS